MGSSRRMVRTATPIVYLPSNADTIDPQFVLAARSMGATLPQLITRVGAVRHASGFVKYWFTIRNVSNQPVEFELRYYVLGWSGQ